MSNIHRIWLGGPMPERFVKYGELWKSLNPSYQFKDWTEEEILDSEWINVKVLQDLYTKSLQPGADMVAYYTQVADVVDYELIYKYGGWYFNTDLKPLKPLNTLAFNLQNAAFAMEDDIHPVNMAMYGGIHNMVFGKIIELLPERYFGMPGAFMNATTGVQLIQDALSRNPYNIHLFPRNVFNPIHWADFQYGDLPEIEREYSNETVAVHEWFHRTNQRGQRVLE